MIIINIPCSLNKFFLCFCPKCTVIADEIYSLFYPYVTCGECSRSKHDVVCVINDHTVDVINDGEIYCKFPYNTVFDAYKRIVRIIQENIILKENNCFLHGATVTYGKNAYLLLAESQMGKSTLCVYLHMKNEFECLADDLAIIDTKNFQISPVSKYIHLRKDALHLININASSKITYNNLINRYQYPLSDSRFKCNYAVKGIFILDRQNNEHNVSKMNNSYMEILYNSYLPFQVKNNVAGAVVLNKYINVWSVKYSTLEQAYQYIRQVCP